MTYNGSPKLLRPCLGLLGLYLHCIEFICVSDPRASEIYARDNEKTFQNWSIFRLEISTSNQNRAEKRGKKDEKFEILR